MNGVILRGFRQFVLEHHGEDAWNAIHDRAGVPRRLYMPAADYPDELVVSLVDAAVIHTGRTREGLLSALGRSLVPDIMTIYSVHVRPEWTTLELIANLEQVLERAFSQNRFTTFEPPTVDCGSIEDDSVSFDLVDDRGLCALYEGILAGFGDHFGEELEIDRRGCTTDGDNRCEFVVALVDKPEPTTDEPTTDEPTTDEPTVIVAE